ncbi:8461_t:CDS:10 [Funneliformis geosporum]|uniref:Cation-transporting ATPase n=1 Tax=Funneliformis geosporum TaxID=1117311 RepID=A0A9W4SB57_9GLOM|nr:8461_t:CDS:10 [Funneliformis geosporum]
MTTRATYLKDLRAHQESMGLEIHDFTEESDNNSVSDIPNMSTGTDYERSSFEDHELGSIIGDSNEDESIDAKIDNKPLLGNMSKMAVNVLYTPGSLFLLARWIPKIWIWWVGIVCVMGKAEFITIKNQWGEIAIEFVNRKYYGGTISSVFSVDQLDEEDMARNNSDPDEILHNLRYFDHRYIRFIYHPGIGKFLQNGYWKDSSWTSTKVLKKGITRAVHDERKIIFGPNIIDVQEKSALRLLTDEVLHPFYIFQVFSMILWFLDEYYYYAACILIISATSVITTLIETKQTMHRLREMSKFVCDVRIFRNGLWRYSSSEVLVPGDVFEISDPGLYVYPCDAILLTGDCIVNESMLTGESVPVSKLPITDASLRMMDLTAVNVRPEIAKHFLFCGTKIVRVRKTKSNIDGIEDEGSALAMVVRTGFNTTKGSLIRSMLFPKPNKFKFYRDAFRFIGILSLIAGIGFFISTINFIRMGVNIHLIIVRALDLITIVVPPALPTTMSIGTSFSLARLRKAQIFCISPARVNIGGKLNVMCFDKTGTLTEDCLDVLGIRCTDHIKNKFSDLHTSIETLSNLNLNDLSESDFTSILYAMATCHSLKLVDGKLIGDPLDLKMFEFTKWLLEESVQNTSCPPNFTRISNESSTSSFRPATPNSMVGSGSIVPTVVRPPGSRKFELSDLLDNDGKDGERKNTPFLELGIIRTFEFVSSLRRMSVLVKRLRSPTIEVYVKGAPEVMREICKPDSIPEDYDELLNYYTHHGFRVIACASRSFDNLNWMKAQKIKREQVEQDLQFLGIIIFENKLKSGTSPVIEKLKRAKIRQIMCTGDNVLTAISVSRECGLINKNTKAYVPRFIQGSSITPRAEIAWESLDDPKDVLDSKTLKPLIQPPSNFSNEYPMINSCDYDLAVTGDIFRWMIDFADEVTLFKMFVKGQIFARMSPDEKHELVEKLQLMGYCVGFCGDGANDCGALKAADVGLSLSEAEASVAAPFTSHTMDIGCVIEVIKEGRAALVTSFSCFKYMALYSIIQFTTVSLLYSFASNLGNFQFLYIDLFLILPVAVLMGRTEPYPLINPKRPTASLVSRRVLTSLIGQILIQSGFQIFVYLLIREQPWYKPPVIDPDDTNIVCFENTILFILSCFQYLLIAAVFSVGPPYRKPMHSNG